MIASILPLLVSMHNLTFCVEKILQKAQFETIALVHLRTTVDVSDNIHDQLTSGTNYALMRFDMTKASTLEKDLLKENLFTNTFFVYLLDYLADWEYVHRFITVTKLNHRHNQIFIVNKFASFDCIREAGKLIMARRYFNAGILFWNASGRGYGLEAYTFTGFKNDIVKVSLVDDQCDDDVYDQMFVNHLIDFHGSSVNIYGHTEPPRIVKTAAMVHGQYEYSIGGHDVLITDAICKHLNATSKYKILLTIAHLVGAYVYELDKMPINNTEQRVFNISQTSKYDWSVPELTDNKIVYRRTGIDLNSQQISVGQYSDNILLKDITFLYPHDTDNFIIIVPKRYKSNGDYDELFESPLVYVWVPVTLSVAIARYFFKRIRQTHQKFGDIYIQTFGLSLGVTTKGTMSSAAEKLLVWWFCLGTMLSGMLLSSSMFHGFALQQNIVTITNLNELEMSGLVVQVPTRSESVEYFFANIPQKLKLQYKTDFDISDMISSRNKSNAYVIREGKFDVLFGNEDNVWHIIERFGFEHLSYKLRLFSSIEDRMNTVLQRCVDHGIVKHLVEKNKRLLTGTKRAKNRNVVSSSVEALSISDMNNLFLLYVVGVVLSAITFIVEKSCFRKRLNQKQRNANKKN